MKWIDTTLSSKDRRLVPVAQLKFEMEYAGPALESGEMDARDFARAVLSTADLFREMGREIYPGDPEVSMNVRALSPGSFHVLLNLLSNPVGVLTSAEITAANNLAGLVNIVGGTIRLIRHRSNNEEVGQEEVLPGIIRVDFGDDQSIEIPAQSLGISEQVSFRRNLAEIVRPLTEDGIETLTFRRDEMVIERVYKSDVPAISRRPVAALPPPGPQSNDRDVWLQVVSVSFRANNKWRFSDGGPPFGARISDSSFLDDIENGEPFRKDDRMHVTLRETQTITSSKIAIEREVVRVIEHVPASQNRRLF